MNVKGKIVDTTTNIGVPITRIDVYSDGSDMSGTPADSFYTDADGNFDYTSNLLETPNATISMNVPGYFQVVQPPSLFQGTIGVEPTVITKYLGVIPTWVYIVIAIAGVSAVIYFLHKYKKI